MIYDDLRLGYSEVDSVDILPLFPSRLLQLATRMQGIAAPW